MLRIQRELPSPPAELFDGLLSLLTQLYREGEPDAKPYTTKAFRQLYHAGIVNDAQMSNLGIDRPNLAGQLSDNLERFPAELAQLKAVTEHIAQDPELSALIYPLVSVGGSRLKGYGDSDSDLDVGIFIKPGTAESEHDRIRQLLAHQLELIGLDDEVFEFWLEENSGSLRVRSVDEAFAGTAAVVADEYWTHILFNAALIGTPEAVAEIHTKLLPAYFYENDESVYGRDSRTLFLERLEQDLLQYRLMHKGYDRHYTRVSQLDWPHAQLIDGGSAFWDSGYRRIAAQLFMQSVFLPKLS